MKLQLINLDPEDDHHSARDKLSWTKADRAVLVWPRRGRVLTRRLDLVLLQRHAQRRGVQLGLIVYDPTVLQHAGELGIPTFETPDRLPEAAWTQAAPAPAVPRPPRRPLEDLRVRAEAIPAPSPTVLQLGRFAGRVLGGLAVVCAVLVGCSVLPSAEIVVSPRREPQVQAMQFILDPDLEQAAGGGQVPAKRVVLQLEGERRLQASGRTQVPSTPATGIAMLTNLAATKFAVPAGTGLRASVSGVRFVTSEAAELDPGEEAEVPIQAAEPGPSGNLPAGAIDGVEGAIGFGLRVTNPDPTSGGQQVSASAVTGADRTRLRRALMAELLAQAAPAMAEPLAPGQYLAPQSVEVSQVLEERFDQEVGQPAATLGLHLRVEFVGLIVELQELQAVAAEQLVGTVPAGRMVIPGSLQLRRDPASDGQLPSGELILGYQAEQQTADRIDLDQIRQAATGQWSSRVPSLLAERFELGRPPQVRIRPPWYPVLPWLDFRLDVQWVWESA